MNQFRYHPIAVLALALALASATLSRESLAQTASKDASAIQHAVQAMDTLYLQGQHAEAESHLLGTMKACSDQCSPATKARLWVYIGIVRADGRNKKDQAKKAFESAIKMDASVQLDRLYAAADSIALFTQVSPKVASDQPTFPVATPPAVPPAAAEPATVPQVTASAQPAPPVAAPVAAPAPVRPVAAPAPAPLYSPPAAAPLAQPAPVAASPAPVAPVPSAVAPPAHNHDNQGSKRGFFLQGGIGYTHFSRNTDYTGFYTGHSERNGGGVGAEILLGGGLGSGIVLGGGIETLSMTASLKDTYTSTSDSTQNTHTTDQDITVIVPNAFLQKYIGNFYARASIGAMNVGCEHISGYDCSTTEFTYGGALGYDFNTAGAWAFSLLAGARFASGSSTEDNTNYNSSYMTYSFKVAGTYY